MTQREKLAEFAGKVALVTGGRAGIGRVIADHLESIGARVVVADLSEYIPNRGSSKNGGVHSIICDVTDEGAIKVLASTVARAFGGSIDILVNCAGTNSECHLIEQMPLDAWERTIRINLTGTMLVTRELIPLLAAGGGGNIVNIASNAGRRGAPYRADYCCSKWALIGFTQTAALELANRGIRVNAINPGPVAGNGIERILEAYSTVQNKDIEELRNGWLANTPLGRFIEPQEVADTVEVLCSNKSASLTGQTIELSGGMIMR